MDFGLLRINIYPYYCYKHVPLLAIIKSEIRYLWPIVGIFVYHSPEAGVDIEIRGLHWLSCDLRRFISHNIKTLDMG